jgi:hypothetical protein
MLAFIRKHITGLRAPPHLEDTGAHLNFEEEETSLETYGFLRGGKTVPLVLLTAENNVEFCLECIGQDIVCLMN